LLGVGASVGVGVGVGVCAGWGWGRGGNGVGAWICGYVGVGVLVVVWVLLWLLEYILYIIPQQTLNRACFKLLICDRTRAMPSHILVGGGRF